MAMQKARWHVYDRPRYVTQNYSTEPNLDIPRHGDACMRQKALFQTDGSLSTVRAWWNHYLDQCWHNVNWTRMHKFQWHSNQSTDIVSPASSSQNAVHQRAAILFRPPFVSRAVSWRHDVMTLTPNSWSFVRDIHLWPVDSPQSGPVIQNFDIFLPLSWTNFWTDNRVDGDLIPHYARVWKSMTLQIV